MAPTKTLIFAGEWKFSRAGVDSIKAAFEADPDNEVCISLSQCLLLSISQIGNLPLLVAVQWHFQFSFASKMGALLIIT
jgi:hypothetical protein